MASGVDSRRLRRKGVTNGWSFGLLLFSTDTELIRRAVPAGVTGIVVDWERDGKEGRQSQADTQISPNTVEDLRRVRAATSAPVICRINGPGFTSEREIEQAIAAGADELLLPMVQSLQDVTAVLHQVGSRCRVGIMLETIGAVESARELGGLPLARTYVGLNDLGLQRGTPNIFTALVDGTVEGVREFFDCPFGVAGLTLPELGTPIPCRLLIGEMARLKCDFSVLRRSFLRDTLGLDLTREIPRLRQALAAANKRNRVDVLKDHVELQAAVAAWDGVVVADQATRDP